MKRTPSKKSNSNFPFKQINIYFERNARVSFGFCFNVFEPKNSQKSCWIHLRQCPRKYFNGTLNQKSLSNLKNFYFLVGIGIQTNKRKRKIITKMKSTSKYLNSFVRKPVPNTTEPTPWKNVIIRDILLLLL